MKQSNKKNIFDSVSHFPRKITVLVIFVIFGICNLYSQEKNEITTITIINSMQTSYTKAQDTGNDLIVLDGNVELSVKKGDNTSVIKADTITYDRQTEMIYASGNVEITTSSSSSGGETTTANSLLMNTSTLEGVFDGGRVVQTKSDALNLPSGSTLIVFSDLFGKTQSNTIAFKNSSLTFCDDDNPHWHIDSSRTWLLPGGEFAFFNALLYVGPVPVLYLPAFYYPKDELIFNPVFSNSKRKGYTIQTTTYLIGRKPLDTSSSSSDEDTTATAESLKALYNFMKPTSLKMQERQGLVLHNLDENFNGSTSKYLKLLTDYYSNLGYLVGIDGAFQPSTKYVTSLKFNINLGLSHTVFPSGDSYSYISSADKTYWDKSNFMGLKTPFRYGANLDLSLSKPFKLTVSMPFYTDPYFYTDFKQRNESMDWISYFLQGDNDDTSSSSATSFVWKINGSYSPILPAFIKPYISSLSMTLTSSVNFGTAQANFSKNENEVRDDNVDKWASYSPERSFYYPTEITPATASVTMSGTLFQWPNEKISASSKKTEKVTYAVPLIKPDELKTEKELAEIKKEETQTDVTDENAINIQNDFTAETKTEITAVTHEEVADDENNSEKTENQIPEVFALSLALPELTSSASSVSVPTGLSYTLGYTINPNITTKLTYGTTYPNDDRKSAPTYLYTQSDFDWDKIKSTMYTMKMPTSVNSNFKYGGNFFTMTNKISWDPIWQGHPNTDGVTISEEKNLILADYKASTQTVSNTNTLSFKPFAYIPVFADTGISWNTTLRLFKKEFKGTSSDENWQDYWKTSDAWESYWLGDYWDDSNWETENEKDTFQRKIISTNTVNFTLGMNELSSKYKQNFTWSMTLPPQLQKHSLSLNLTFPYVSNSISWSFQEKTTSSSSTDENDKEEKKEWTYNSLSQAATFSLFDSSLKLSESVSIITDPKTLEENNRTGMDIFDNLKFSISWKKLSAAFTMNYTTDYWLDRNGGGWTAKINESGKELKKFIPYTLSFSWSPTSKTHYKWGEKISFTPGLSTSIVADLVRSTNSYLLFTPSFTLKINNFLDLTFSASSRNSTLYWYFQGDDSIYANAFPLGNNFFSMFFGDLIRSFGIGESEFRANREASGFKLKSLNMVASHEMHDWSFNMSWKFEPKLVRKNNTYVYNFDPYISIGIVWKPMESMKTTIVHEYDKGKEDTIWELNPQ